MKIIGTCSRFLLLSSVTQRLVLPEIQGESCIILYYSLQGNHLPLEKSDAEQSTREGTSGFLRHPAKTKDFGGKIYFIKFIRMMENILQIQ